MVDRNLPPRRSGSHVRRSSAKYGAPARRGGPSLTTVQILAVGLMTAFLSGIFAVGISPSFVARNFEIHGATFTSESIVRSILGMDGAPNAFRIDTSKAAAQLVRLPAVESASVQVRLPSTVVVTLVERQPKLVWVIGGQRYVIDQEGVIFGLVDAAGNPIESSAGPLETPNEESISSPSVVGSEPSVGAPTESPSPSPTPSPSPKKTTIPKVKATPTKSAKKGSPSPSTRASSGASANSSANATYNPSLVPSLAPLPTAELGASSGPGALSLPVVLDRRASDVGMGLGGIVDPINLDAGYRLAGLTPAEVGSKSLALAVVLDDIHGFTVSSVPSGWVAEFGFYAPTVRKTSVIPGQVQGLKSILAYAGEARVAWVFLVSDVSDSHDNTYLPR